MDITFEKFMELLRGYGTAVHAETYGNLLRYNGNKIKFSLEHGCAVMLENYAPDGQGIYIGIYQTAPDGDIALATEEQIKKAKEYIQIYNNPEVCIKSAVVSNDPLDETWERLDGWRCFSCQGRKCADNPDVRKLTSKETPSVKAFLEPYLHSEDHFERAEARTMDWQADHFERMTDNRGFSYYGFYKDDKLCGIATARCIEELNIAWLLDIFVSSQHRNKGVGKALVSGTLGQWPDKKWLYQSERDNVRSIALAKSLGFMFEGASLTQVVKPE